MDLVQKKMCLDFMLNSSIAVIDHREPRNDTTDYSIAERREDHQTTAATIFNQIYKDVYEKTPTTSSNNNHSKKACFSVVLYHEQVICHLYNKQGHYQKMYSSSNTTKKAMIHLASCVSVDTINIPVGHSHAATFVTVENRT